jgi:hypothetical protein
LLAGQPEDFADQTASSINDAEVNAVAPDGGEFVGGYPKRMAMLASEVKLAPPESLQILKSKEETLRDCFHDGYQEGSSFTVRVFVDPQGGVSRVETVGAEKMSLKIRACITEVIENTKFNSNTAGGSFVFKVAPKGNP